MPKSHLGCRAGVTVHLMLLSFRDCVCPAGFMGFPMLDLARVNFWVLCCRGSERDDPSAPAAGMLGDMLGGGI